MNKYFIYGHDHHDAQQGRPNNRLHFVDAPSRAPVSFTLGVTIHPLLCLSQSYVGENMAVSLATLQGYVGKAMADICANGFTSPSQNHCAHFVGHAHGITLGMLCGDMTFKTKKTGASIRCDELYNGLTRKGKWEDKPELSDGLLVFVLSARNIMGGTMVNVPQKHVGICFGGKVYNFSNSQHKVVADESVEAFHNKFKRIYAGNDVSLFFGVAP